MIRVVGQNNWDKYLCSGGGYNDINYVPKDCLILATKLRNSLNRFNPNGNYEYRLKNIIVNGYKKGCSGFIVNKDNGLIVYVNTEPCIPKKPYVWRYATSLKDTRGGINHFADCLANLTAAIYEALKESDIYESEVRHGLCR